MPNRPRRGGRRRAPSRAYIGTSGWNYDAWRAGFYGGRPKRDWLAFCARRFSALEINATFYRLQRKETFARWRDATPESFRFALKANRYLTHNRKLARPLAPIRLERARAAGLGAKLSAVLWQLPANFHRDLARLEAFARALQRWACVRHAIEFRHPSWFSEEVAAFLHRHRIAVCQSDAADWPLWEAVTTDLVYLRLHGRPVTYASDYPEAALRRWARKVRGWLAEGREVQVYFDNDARGCAPRNAMRLIRLLAAEPSAGRTRRARRARPIGQRERSARNFSQSLRSSAETFPGTAIARRR